MMNSEEEDAPVEDKTITIEAWRVHPPHEQANPEKVKAIAASLRENGWSGRPILVEPLAADGTAFVAWTGAARVMACLTTGEKVVAIPLNMGFWTRKYRGKLKPGQSLLDFAGATDEDRLQSATRVGDLDAILLLSAEIRVHRAGNNE